MVLTPESDVREEKMYSGVTEWSFFPHKWSLVEFRQQTTYKLLSELTLISDSWCDPETATFLILTGESNSYSSARVDFANPAKRAAF